MLSNFRAAKYFLVAVIFTSALAGCSAPAPETPPVSGAISLQQAREKAIKEGKVPPP